MSTSPRAGLLALSLVLATLASHPAFAQQTSPSQPPQTTFPEQKTTTDPTPPAAPTAAAEGEEDPSYAMRRQAWFMERRAYPFATIPAGARARALAQHQAMRAASVQSLPAGTSASPQRLKPLDAFTTLTWTFDGPSSLATAAGQTPYSGRATALAIHPTNQQIMYLGTAGGGVWKTTDGGTTWSPLTDTQPSLAIGAIVIDPNTPTTLYVGTGEPDYSLDSYYGQGLLKSTDSGTTWTQIASPFVGTYDAAPFASIVIQPGNSSVLLAATEAGIYRSTNGGASWTNQLPSYASVVLFDPNHPNTAYAGMNGYYNSIVHTSVTSAIYKSTDGGVTWTALASALPAGSTVFRTALTMDSSGNLLAGIAPSNLNSGIPYKSTDGGTTWTALTAPGDGIDWYRDWIVSVPGSPNILYTGGISLYQSLNGGQTWTKSTESYATLLWADQHTAVFSPDGSKMYLMDDGGIFMTSSPGATNPTFTSLNNGIGTMTYYPGFAILPGSTNRTLIGSQDHGVQTYTGSTAFGYAGGGNGVCGDGGPVTLDSAGVYAYAHCQGSPLSSWMVSATGGATASGYPYGWTSIQNGLNTNDRTAWIPPIASDLSNASNMYTGTYRVYQTTNRGGIWLLISGDLTAGSATLNTIAVAPGNPNVVYAGAGDGTVSVTTNALSGTSATWKTLTGLPNRAIAKIIVQPDSPQDVFVAVSGFGTGHLFHSTNGGTTWTDVSGNIPDTPVNSVLADPSLLNTLYLATDTGVYVSSTGGTSWEVLGSNLPNVVVEDLQFVPNTRILRIITHGRGAWDVTLPVTGLVASTNALSFGGQTIQTTSAAQTVIVTNNFATSATVSGITTTGAFSQTNNCAASLASGASCTISVTFSPTSVGAATGALTATFSQGVISVLLAGSGIGVPAVTFGPAPAYNPVVAGFTGQTLIATVNNTGSNSLSITSSTIAGTNATDFLIAQNCQPLVYAGGACQVYIQFNPTGVGTRTAALTLADNAPNSPQTLTLTGTGLAPFSLTAATTSATVKEGASATYPLTVTAAAGTTTNQNITLTCTGLPNLSACVFSPASISAGITTQNVTLTITTTATTGSISRPPLGRHATEVLSCTLLLALCLLPKRRRSLLSLLLLAILATGVTACSKTTPASSTPGTTPGTYTVTVTAAAPNYSTTQALTLNVTQ